MITKLEAFSFLKEHQPMPSDDELTKQDIEKYVAEYDLDSETLTKFVGEIKSIFEGTEGLSKEEIETKLNEILQQ